MMWCQKLRRIFGSCALVPGGSESEAGDREDRLSVREMYAGRRSTGVSSRAAPIMIEEFFQGSLCTTKAWRNVESKVFSSLFCAMSMHDSWDVISCPLGRFNLQLGIVLQVPVAGSIVFNTHDLCFGL